MPNTEPHTPPANPKINSPRAIRWIYIQSIVLTLVLFYFHIVLIFDVAGDLLSYRPLFISHFGEHQTGKLMVLGTFFILFIAHLSETIVWGLFLHRGKIVPTFLEGVYFVGATISTLGYGDVVPSKPWREIGPLIAISGVLKFGCSTAFLFFVIQNVWTWTF